MSAIKTNICIYSLTEGPGDSGPTGALVSHLSHAPLRFRVFGDLLDHLQSPVSAEDIIVLAPVDADELAGFLTHKRLQDRRLVLILPDAEEATLSLAHLLGPRYLCFADDVETDLAAVLNKMTAHDRSRFQSEGVVG